MMLFTHAPLLATVACLGYCLHFSAITAFAFSSRPAAVKHSYANHNMSTTSTSLHYSINRRAVFTVVPVATFATLFIPSLGDDATNMQYHARADEPNNVFYKSKADEEDPLAVFGRSLQQSIPTSTTDAQQQQRRQQQGIEEQSNNKVTEELLPGGGDLGKALLEKQKERRIDPRTHG
jgi:hypothetical protein